MVFPRLDNKGGANYRGQLRLLLAPFFVAGLNISEICIFLGLLASVFRQLYADAYYVLSQ